jgi:hypothetical protein
VLVSFVGGLTGFDMALKAHNLSRRVVASLPMFPGDVCGGGQGGCPRHVPAHLATAYAKPFGLKVYKPPMPMHSFSVVAVRHARSHGDHGLDWITGRIGALVS